MASLLKSWKFLKCKKSIELNHLLVLLQHIFFQNLISIQCNVTVISNILQPLLLTSPKNVTSSAASSNLHTLFKMLVFAYCLDNSWVLVFHQETTLYILQNLFSRNRRVNNVTYYMTTSFKLKVTQTFEKLEFMILNFSWLMQTSAL